jgi:hypothetical protein
VAKKKKVEEEIKVEQEVEVSITSDTVEGETLPEITDAPIVEATMVKEEKPKRKRATTKKSTIKKEEAPKEADKKDNKADTKAIEITHPVWLYANSAIKTTTKTISGKVYLWANEKVTGRYPITKDENGAYKLHTICGWVNASDLGMD